MQEEQKAAAAQVPASPPNILIETPSGVTPGSGTPPGSTETRTNILADEASEASRMKREEALEQLRQLNAKLTDNGDGQHKCSVCGLLGGSEADPAVVQMVVCNTCGVAVHQVRLWQRVARGGRPTALAAGS